MNSAFELITKFVLLVYERSGNFGLIWFLAIIVINLYGFWWWLPKQAQVTTKSLSSISLLYFNTGFAIANLVFSTFLAGVLSVSQINGWIKVLSGIVLVAVSITAIYALMSIMLGKSR